METQTRTAGPSRVGRNPFQKKAAIHTAGAPLKAIPISRQLIEEAIADARRAEAEAKARVAKQELSFAGRVAGWLAVDFVAGTYVFGLRAFLFAKEAFKF